MNAIYNADKNKIVLDNEAVKAIRFVRGLNTDLRVSLKSINKESLWHWIDENAINLFGVDFEFSKPQATDEKFSAYEKCIDDVVRQIIR